jgi:hypothetical protein
LKEGARQTNLLSDLGFHQVYLYVFIVVDSRELNGGKFAFEGSTTKIRSLMEREIGVLTTTLRAEAGLYVCEFTQSMDDVPLTTGGFGGKLARIAQQKSQNPELTAWVSRITKSVAPSRLGERH